jgi:hypothetical protein
MKNRQAEFGAFVLVLFPIGLWQVGAAGALTQDATAATTPAPATADDDEWHQELAAWRAQRERDVSAPDGWLTLVGLEWLKPGFNSFGAAADNPIHLRAQAPEHMGILTVSGNTCSGQSRER